MKIHLIKLYKTTILFFLVSGTAVIIGTVILTVVSGQVNEPGGRIMLILSISMGIALICFPFLLFGKNLSSVALSDENCISCSFLGKFLCPVDYSRPVFYSFFDVRFTYSAPMKFIALSNEPFSCVSRNGVFKAGFYGAYDPKKIIVFPYDNKTAPWLAVDCWQLNDPYR